MSQQQSSRPLSLALESFLEMLVLAGFSDADAELVIKSQGNRLAEEILYLVRTGAEEPTPSQKRAKETFGANYLGPEVAVRRLKLRLTQSDRYLLNQPPFSSATLGRNYLSHLLVAVFPLSIAEMWKKFNFFFEEKRPPAFMDELFMQDNGGEDSCWHLVRKHNLPGSGNQPESAQLKMMRENVRNSVVPARVIVYTMLAYYLSTGRVLYNAIHVRTASRDSAGRSVCVGYENGLRIHLHPPEEALDFVGLATQIR